MHPWFEDGRGGHALPKESAMNRALVSTLQPKLLAQ
jgi:hypothetical protein